MFNYFFQFVRVECLLVLPEPENLRAKHTRKVSILKPVLIFGCAHEFYKLMFYKLTDQL